MGKKVTKEVTLGIMESIVEGKAEFTNFGPLSDLQIMDIPGFEADLSNQDYREAFIYNLKARIDLLKETNNGLNELPNEAAYSIMKLVNLLAWLK